MKYLIPIDKTSIKENKDAGSTFTHVYSGDETKFTCDKLPYFFETAIPDSNYQLTSYEIDDNGDIINCEGYIFNYDYVVNRCLKEKIPINIVTKVNYTTINHPPISKYHYNYQPIEITCSECGEKFLNTELLDNDNDEYFNDRVCPKCGAEDCCELEYEKI